MPSSLQLAQQKFEASTDSSHNVPCLANGRSEHTPCRSADQTRLEPVSYMPQQDLNATELNHA